MDIDKKLSMCLSGDTNDLKDVLHFTLDVLVMDVNWALICGSLLGFTLLSPCQQRDKNLFAQNEEASHGFKPLWGSFVELGVFDPTHQLFAPKLLEIIRGVTRLIIGYGTAEDFFNLCPKVRCREASRFVRESDDSFHHRLHARPIDIDPPYPSRPNLRRKGPGLQFPVIDERNIHATQDIKESFQDGLERCNDLGKPVDSSSTAQLLGVVSNRLNSKNAFAFAIDLEGQLSKMDLKDRQIIDRSLDHDLESGRMLLAMVAKGTTRIAKDGLDGLYIQRGSRSINDAVKNLIQSSPTRKEKVTAILALINRIGVMKATVLLFRKIQSETQAGRVNPTLTHSDQAPYRARSSHGICDSGQAWSVGDLSKTVAFFGKRKLGLLGLTGHVFMPVEHNLSRERRMRTEFDGQVPPLWIEDMERIMIDVRIGGFRPDVDGATVEAVYMENRGRSKPSDDTEHPPEGGVLGEMLLGQFMLVFSGLTMDQRDSLLLGIGVNPSTKSTGKPHEMGVVQGFIRSRQLTPPSPKTTRGLSQTEISIEYDAIYTIICTIEIFLIIAAKLVGHHHLSFPLRQSWVKTIKYKPWAIKSTAPKGPPPPGEVPEEA